jgi:predicted RNA-binding Zn ribbon-like protein
MLTLTMQPVTEMPFVGGDLAVDFVNTAEERGHPEAGEALHGPSDLRLWGQRYGVLSARLTDGEDRAEFRRAREARELLYDLFLARAHGRKLAGSDLDRLAELAGAAYRAGRLERGPDGELSWHWDPGRLASVRHGAVAAAVDLLRRSPAPHLKQCPGEHCGWFFLDQTKRGNRRWCSMSDCGQEAKNARRRKRLGSSPND